MATFALAFKPLVLELDECDDQVAASDVEVDRLWLRVDVDLDSLSPDDARAEVERKVRNTLSDLGRYMAGERSLSLASTPSPGKPPKEWVAQVVDAALAHMFAQAVR